MVSKKNKKKRRSRAAIATVTSGPLRGVQIEIVDGKMTGAVERLSPFSYRVLDVVFVDGKMIGGAK